MVESNFKPYEIKKINERTWRIGENSMVAMYLLEGDEKAVMIDSGWGTGKLAGLAASLTKKPISVILTHGHRDHVCGAYQLRDVYMAKEDENYVRACYNDTIRKDMFENRLKDIAAEDFSKEEWLHAKLDRVHYLNDGDVFDLGGRTLKVIATPGHTPGSICLLDEADGMLFSGDSIQLAPILMLLGTSLTLRQYFGSLKKIEGYKGKLSMILPGHGEFPIGYDVVEDLMGGVASVLDGRVVGELQQTFFGEGLVCKFNKATLIYKSDNL